MEGKNVRKNVTQRGHAKVSRSRLALLAAGIVLAIEQPQPLALKVTVDNDNGYIGRNGHGSVIQTATVNQQGVIFLS